MKNFLFDLTATQASPDGRYHGGGKYAKKVLFALIKYNSATKWKLHGLYDSKYELDIDIKNIIKTNSIELLDIRSSELQKQWQMIKPNRIYSALPSKRIISLSSDYNLFTTIHGLRFIEAKMGIDALKYSSGIKSISKTLFKIIASYFFEKKYYNQFRYLIDRSTIVTVSNYTKFSILSYFPNFKKDIKVFYSPDVTELDDGEENELFEEVSNYFLIVSGNRWVKNGMASAFALDNLFSERKEVNQKVIITGVVNPNIYLKRIKNKDRFLFYDYVSERRLKYLYQHAYALLYTSLNEGFGYPPLEAMKSGLPVIASPFTAITEVCSNAVLYANPLSIHEIKAKILQLKDPSVYQELKLKGFEQYKLVRERQERDLTELTNYLYHSEN